MNKTTGFDLLIRVRVAAEVRWLRRVCIRCMSSCPPYIFLQQKESNYYISDVTSRTDLITSLGTCWTERGGWNQIGRYNAWSHQPHDRHEKVVHSQPSLVLCRIPVGVSGVSCPCITIIFLEQLERSKCRCCDSFHPRTVSRIQPLPLIQTSKTASSPLSSFTERKYLLAPLNWFEVLCSSFLFLCTDHNRRFRCSSRS